MFGKKSSGNLRLIGWGWLGIAVLIFVVQLTHKPSVVIRWSTESEQETAGFHVTRSESESGPFSRINQTLIPAKGSPTHGAAYEFMDRDVVAGTLYFYQLEEVELDSSTSRYANETTVYRAVRFSWWAVGLTAVSAIIGCFLLIKTHTAAHENP